MSSNSTSSRGNPCCRDAFEQHHGPPTPYTPPNNFMHASAGHEQSLFAAVRENNNHPPPLRTATRHHLCLQKGGGQAPLFELLRGTSLWFQVMVFSCCRSKCVGLVVVFPLLGLCSNSCVNVTECTTCVKKTVLAHCQGRPF